MDHAETTDGDHALAEELGARLERLLVVVFEKSWDELREALDGLEREFAAREASEEEHTELEGMIAEYRFQLTTYKDRPVLEARQFLDLARESAAKWPWYLLNHVYIFACYCFEHGAPALGARYLRKVLADMDWSAIHEDERADARSRAEAMLAHLEGTSRSSP